MISSYFREKAVRVLERQANKGETRKLQQLVILLLINYSSTCFERLYTHSARSSIPALQHHNSYNKTENHRQ